MIMIMNINIFSDYNTIMLYLSMDDEVSCDAWIQSLLVQGKTVLIPYGEGWVYECVHLTSRNELQQGRRWIRTVKNKEIRSDSIECIVCPGRFFTRDGCRKWRGWWWYDRFLAKHPESHKIWLCYKHQIVDHLEQRSWDIKMDKMIII